IHVAGVRWFGRLQVWMCVVLGVSIVVLVVPGLFAIRMSNYRPFFTGGVGGFAASLPPIFFAYAGFEALAQTAGVVLGSLSRAPHLAVFALVAIHFLRSIPLICIPRPLFEQVTVRIPRWLQLLSAWLSIAAMGTLIALQLSDRKLIVLVLFWSAIGLVLYVS